jgi:hypothetical protein
LTEAQEAAIVSQTFQDTAGGSMTRKQELMLAALAAAKGDAYTPVQLQKLIFLLDKNLPHGQGGGQFDFTPYDYGPFDASVYGVAEQLAGQSLVEVCRNDRTGFRTYEATALGVEAGERILSQFQPEVRDYILALSRWVRALSFADLITAIYTAYPDMKVNSVFQDAR